MGETKTGASGGNGERTTRKLVVTAGRESERLIVPSRPGNRYRRDPAEGRRRRDYGIAGGKHGRGIETGSRVN
jgi:hypothetical protein